MRVFVYVTLLFPLAAGPLARALTVRVHPRSATWLMTLAALMLAGTSCGALGLLALAALVRIPLAARLGHWSLGVVVGGDSTSTGVALAAGVLFGAALLGICTFAVRRVRALADAHRHARGLPGRGSVVVIEDAAADAYTVPGRPGRIVVSAGMLSALGDAGRAALLAHERSHLAGRHHLFTSVARLAAAANPLLRPLARAVDYTVERWADERAATVVGSRRLVAETIAQAAVATKATRPQRTLLVALGAIFGRSRPDAISLSGTGPVPRRVAALLAPPPRPGLPVIAASVLFVLVAAYCALEAANDLQDLLSLAHAVARRH